MDPDQSTEIKPDSLARCTLRWGLLAFAWLNVALGMIGVVVPGMPTTIFLIIAVWAFPNVRSVSSAGCGTTPCSGRRSGTGTNTG